MSGQEVKPAAAPTGDEQAVVEHLRRHPDFLFRHPDLVASMLVPHECGAAVSLIEYQVEALRSRCQDLGEHLASLVENARSNEDLAQRLHRLVLALVDSDGLDELFASLYQGLEESFGADMVSLRIFAHAAHGADRGLAELVGPVAEQRLFATLLDSGQPSCGGHDERVLAWLFAGRAQRVRSAALLPLAIGEHRGVLAIGSHSSGRFRASMGTLYLRQLAEVLGRLLARQVR